MMATPAEQRLIDAWIAKNGVTKCPPRAASGDLIVGDEVHSSADAGLGVVEGWVIPCQSHE